MWVYVGLALTHISKNCILHSTVVEFNFKTIINLLYKHKHLSTTKVLLPKLVNRVHSNDKLLQGYKS